MLITKKKDIEWMGVGGVGEFIFSRCAKLEAGTLKIYSEIFFKYFRFARIVNNVSDCCKVWKLFAQTMSYLLVLLVA